MKKLLAVLVLCLFPFYGYGAAAADNFHVGVEQYQAGNWRNAIAYFKQVVQSNPGDWQAYQYMGYAYYRLNDTQKCLSNCESSLDINPNNPKLQAFVDKLKAVSMPAPEIEAAPDNPPASHGPLPPLPMIGHAAHKQIFNSIYLNGGWSMPTNPAGFATNWTTGPSFGFGYGVGLNRMTSLVLSGQYCSFPQNIISPYEYESASGAVSPTLLF